MAQRSRSSSDSTVLLLHRKEAPAQRNALRNSEVPSICRNNRWMTRKLPASKSDPGLLFSKASEQIFIDLHIVAFDLIYRPLIAIARKTGTKKRQACPGAEHTMSFYHILEYIDSHSSEPLEVQELARLCHMSYSHFAKLFRENYGRSCKEYIKYIRLNKAQDLLVNSDLDIDYIAQETGFYDSSHFIRQYKSWRGITPKQERKFIVS